MPGAATLVGAGALLLLSELEGKKYSSSVTQLVFNIVSCCGQLEELRASECALRVRVKSLTSELALLRRGLDNLSVYNIFAFSLFYLFTCYADATIYLLSACLLCVSAAE